MKFRESGMPEETYWETLFDVNLILDRLGIDRTLQDVVELGCGYGTFTLPVARRIAGHLTTMDIDPAMVARTTQRVAEAGLTNVSCWLRDVQASGFGLDPESCDACLLFNILHGEEPVHLLTESTGIVRPGGFIHVIHWRYDPNTPRGPSLKIRPRPAQIVAWAEQTDLLVPEGPVLDLPPWHYGVRLRRPLPYAT